jgi:uncharacterized protein involved in exopolysaccharide biosynthesis
MKSRLEEVEAQLKRYRESYMGELPEQLESNLRILDRLQEHLGESQQNLSDAKIRLAALQNEAAAYREQPATVIVGQDNRQETNDIDQMRAELENLLSRYTERHPDVVRLKSRIAELEKQAAAYAENNPTDDSNTTSRNQAAALPPRFRTQYAEIVQEMKRLELDIEDTKKQVSLYQRRVENTPKREQELLSLKRDYQNIQATYDSLLERKLEVGNRGQYGAQTKRRAVQDPGPGQTSAKTDQAGHAKAVHHGGRCRIGPWRRHHFSAGVCGQLVQTSGRYRRGARTAAAVYRTADHRPAGPAFSGGLNSPLCHFRH